MTVHANLRSFPKRVLGTGFVSTLGGYLERRLLIISPTTLPRCGSTFHFAATRSPLTTSVETFGSSFATQIVLRTFLQLLLSTVSLFFQRDAHEFLSTNVAEPSAPPNSRGLDTLTPWKAIFARGCR
jgi:hypothetical protein